MTSIVIFTISGLAITFFVATKGVAEKRKRAFYIFDAISSADSYVREIYHKSVRFYDKGKEKIFFLFKKQVPIHSKNSINKLIFFLQEKRKQYIENMRDSRLLKKSDGISEFFKNMSEIEKGNGEINDVYEDGSQEDRKELN